jgi:hypothetical protein
MTKRLAFMLALALGACAGSGTGRVEYAAAVTVRSPELVALEDSPDVYVLADADEPVFYTDNNYWLYRNNRWYRSHSYDRDWVYVSTPSPRIRQIHQPTAYARYQTRRHEARNTPAQQQPQPWRDDQERSDVRQAPLQPTEPQQAPQPYPPPPQQQSPVDDHRGDHRDDRRDDHRIEVNPPVSPSSPAPRDQVRNDLRVPDDGSYERAPGAPAPARDGIKENDRRGDGRPAPGAVKDDVPQPPPGQIRKDDTSTHPGLPPGQIKKQDREDEKADKAERRDEKKDEKAKAKDAKSEKDKKRDY